MFKKQTPLLAAFLVAAFSAFAQTNLPVSNAGFEANATSLTNDWGPQASQLASITTQAHSGQRAAKFDKANTVIFQTLPATAGKTYKLNFWKNGILNFGGQSYARIKFLSATWQIVGQKDEGLNLSVGWKNDQSVELAAPATAKWVEISFFQGVANQWILDDVTLTESGGTTGVLPNILSFSCFPLGTPHTISHADTLLAGEPLVSPSCGMTVQFNQSAPPAITFKQAMYLSTDEILSSNDVLIGSQTFSNILPNNGPTQFITTSGISNFGQIPANTPSGKYYIISKTDSDNQVAETDETDNVTVSAQKTLIGATMPAPQPPTTCSGNVLQNAGFEQDFANWDGSGGEIATGAASVSGGSKSLKMCASGQTRRQTLAATVGKKYRFQWTAKTAGAGQNILFGLKFLSATWQPLGTEWLTFDSPTAFSAHFIEKTAPTGTKWVEVSITKQNAGCVFIDDLCLTDGGTVTPPPPTGKPDLEITVSSDKTTVPQWGNFTATIKLENKGTAAATGIAVAYRICNGSNLGHVDQNSGIVYAGVPPAASLGTLIWLSEGWIIPSLGAGQSATIALPLFTLTPSERGIMAWVLEETTQDLDSQAGFAPTNCQPTQDDEAILRINVGNPLLGGNDRQENGAAAKSGGDFSIFPNPTTGQTSVFLEQQKGKKVEISVVDAVGKTVFFEKIEQVEQPIFDLDLNSQNAGVYFLKMQAEGERTVVKRLIINKL